MNTQAVDMKTYRESPFAFLKGKFKGKLPGAMLCLATIAMSLPATVHAQEARRGGRDGRRRPGIERQMPAKGDVPAFRSNWLIRMKDENPEEFERLQNLRRENPEAFRELMRERFRERVGGTVGQRRAHDTQSRELAAKYRVAADDEKAAIKEQLEASVYEAFDARLANQQRLVEQLEQQLVRLRERIEERKENRDETCQKRIAELTAAPDEPAGDD